MFCFRCYHYGHTIESCLLQGISIYNLEKRDMELIEVIDNKYYNCNSFTEMCVKCQNIIHLNPDCKKVIFIYRKDLD
jgi:hypothetical protein